MTSKRKRGAMTLAEHDALLKAEGRYEEVQAVHRRQEEERERHAAELRQAEAPLVKELRKVGLQVESVWDFVNTREPYPEAIPILMEQLEGDYPPEYPAKIRSGIARALAVPVLASEDWHVLLRCYRLEPDPQVRFALSLALQVNARREHYPQLLELVRDPSVGQDRVVFAEALYRFPSDEVTSLLKSLTSDPELGENIQRILKTGTAVIR